MTKSTQETVNEEFDIVVNVDEGAESSSDEDFDQKTSSNIMPAWIDKEDEQKSAPFIPLFEEKEEDNSEDEDIGTRFISVASKYDDVKRVKIKRTNFANIERPARSEITSVDFNKKFELLLNSSLDTSLSIFKVDSKQCELVKDVVFEKFPIHSAKFLNCGEKILMSSQDSPYLRIYDLETQTEVRSTKLLENDEKIIDFAVPSRSQNQIALGTSSGKIIVTDLRTLDKSSVLYSSGSVNTISYSDDDQLLGTGNDSGEVFIFSNGKISSRWKDNGNYNDITKLTFSPNSRWIACGSYAGIVNVYNLVDTTQNDCPIPIKIFDQLKQSISSCVFSNDNRMLFISSKLDKGSHRLINMNYFSPYENFPLHRGLEESASSCCFSPNNRYMCVGLKSGKSVMYCLDKYKNY